MASFLYSRQGSKFPVDTTEVVVERERRVDANSRLRRRKHRLPLCWASEGVRPSSLAPGARPASGRPPGSRYQARGLDNGVEDHLACRIGLPTRDPASRLATPQQLERNLADHLHQRFPEQLEILRAIGDTSRPGGGNFCSGGDFDLADQAPLFFHQVVAAFEKDTHPIRPKALVAPRYGMPLRLRTSPEAGSASHTHRPLCRHISAPSPRGASRKRHCTNRKRNR